MLQLRDLNKTYFNKEGEHIFDECKNSIEQRNEKIISCIIIATTCLVFVSTSLVLKRYGKITSKTHKINKNTFNAATGLTIGYNGMNAYLYNKNANRLMDRYNSLNKVSIQ